MSGAESQVKTLCSAITSSAFLLTFYVFPKEDYYVQEIDVFGYFRFGSRIG
jgi:hypothetical protein